MKKAILNIAGPDLRTFAREFQQFCLPGTSWLEEQNFIVFYGEKFFFRVSSDLMYTMICTPHSDRSTKVYVMVGGGGHGLPKVTWGAEGSWEGTLVERIAEVCNKNGWQLQVQDWID